MLKLTQKPHAMQKSYKEWRTAFERASAAPHNGDTYNIHGGLAAGKSKHRPFRDEKKNEEMCVCIVFGRRWAFFRSCVRSKPSVQVKIGCC